VRQMPKSIERYHSENIVQGYLAIDVTGAEVQLRKVGERYFETYEGSGHLQLNVYHGNLEGLVLAEVEFSSRDKSEEFEPPDWLGEEVTDDVRYKNQILAKKGAPVEEITQPQ
jgi:CYTH domain-containing protein